jgi:hypothetical protein
VSRWTPSSRREFIRRLRKLGFDGPYSGTRHQFMVYEQYRLAIPSNEQVYEADPLMCPRCTGPMRIIAFIEQPEVIDLPVPGTADREDPDPPGTLAHPHPQPAGRGTRCRLPCNGSHCRLVS